jgi:predicted acylesterase/phospholipase RssA
LGSKERIRALRAELASERTSFRRRAEESGAEQVWKNFPGRIGVALSGGGARGSYEAGVLLAFQDAKLPTHILTATSIGSINAAGFAASSGTLVGNAEPVVEAWYSVTPPAVGIEWTRYAWILGGLIAASAGFANLVYHLLRLWGLTVPLRHPEKLWVTWLFLGLAGGVVLFLYDTLPYLGYGARFFLRGEWARVDGRKFLLSVAGNVIVWGFVALAMWSFRLEVTRLHGYAAAGVAAGFLAALMTRERWRAPLSEWLRKLLRAPLRPGLFPNYERARFLKNNVNPARLRASPIRVLFSATDLETGEPRFFSNATREALQQDPGADERFIAREVEYAEDLIAAIVASTAIPIAFEPLPLGGKVFADGAIRSNQPVRPAIRMGADVLFVVMMDPLAGEGRREKMETFIDVGLRALDILMRQNLDTDLQAMAGVNATCEQAAQQLGLRAEEVELRDGERRYRYVRAFAICPTEPLPGGTLDFDAEAVNQAILRGYRDGAGQVMNFLHYAREAKFSRPRRTLEWRPQS